jgi:predicted RNA-binding protein Jag
MSADSMGGESQADMNEPKRRFFSGDTLQQALVQAANHFHLQPEEIEYVQVEKRHGFTKVRRKVVIDVNPDSPKRVAPAPVARAAVAAEAPRGAGRPERAPAAGGGEVEPRPVPAAGGPAAADNAVPRRGDPGAGGAGAAGAAAGDDRGNRAGRADGRDGGRGDRGARGRFDRGGDRGARGGARRPSGAYPRERRFGEGGLGGQEAAGAGRGESFGNRAPRSGGAAGAEGEGLVALPEAPRSIGERYPAAEGPQAEAAAKGVELLLRIAGLSLTPHIYKGEERLEIDLVGADTDWCFADDGELLMAFEHLLPRIIRSLSGEAVLCRVDCDNFHEIREERLRSLAQKAADEVRQRGRARTLVPMNPADRRIVHVTLADDPAVVTESEGEGYFKRITVRPA